MATGAMIATATATRRTIAVALFIALCGVYWYSVPTAFNTVYMNRQFFDSDGEFITRQFRLGSVFTHNDHLLYHVIGRVGARVAGAFGHVDPSAVAVHKLLSVVSGALAGALLFVLGARLSGRLWGSLGAALLMTGCAGWWFFSATIDTYMPNVLASIVALGAALRCLRTQRPIDYALLGAGVGLAFLFRTDSFLLVVLGGVLAADPSRIGRNLAACMAGGLLIGVAGYAMLAWAFYDVRLADVLSWSLGHSARPEASRTWGLASNVTLANAALVIANHAVYAIWLPGLTLTRVPDVRAVGLGALMVHGLLVVTAVGGALASLRAGSAQRSQSAILIGIAAAWLASRVAFYAWWDPADPFLFAGLSLPALWLVAIHACRDTDRLKEEWRPASIRVVLSEAVVWLAAVMVWWHNWGVLVAPLRAI